MFPDFQPIKRSLGPACFSLFTAGMNLQTQLVSDDFARKTRERHRQQVAWADLGAELGRRWETVIRDIEQIKSERAVLLEGRPENLPRVAAEMRAELESLWTPFATWLERAQHEHFPWIAPLLSDDVKPVSLSAFPSDAMDPNVHIIPSLQVPQQFSTPDWIPALRKAGINPLLPANLGYDLEGLAGLWKLTLAMMLGALGGEVDSKLVHPDLRAVLMRSGVPVADAVDDLHAGGSGETVGRLGSIMGTVVADFIAGKLESLRTIADEAKRASDELESTVTDVALTVPQIKRTSVAPMEVEPSFSPVGLPSASSAAHPLETRKLSLPIPFIATKEPSPSPSMQKSAMDSLDLDSLQTPFARPASRSSRASLDPPAPPFSIDPVASVADDPLDFLLPSVAMPSLRLGGARAILSSVDSIGGAFEFPPTPPRISPHGTAEKEKAKTKPIVAKKATAPASLGYGKGRSPAKTLMKRLASSTSSSLVSSPAGTSVSRSPRRSSTVSSSRAKPTPVPNSADTAAPRTSKPKLAGFDKLCEQIAASAPVPKVPTTAGPTPVSTSRSTSIASRPTTVRVPTSAASRPKKPQPSVTDDPDYAAFSTRAEIPRTPVSAKPASRAPAPSSPNPPSQAQALSVSFAPDVVTPKKDNSGLSSAIKKMATPGSAKNPSGLRNRLWPPASAGSSPAKSEGRDPDKDPPMIFEELAPFDLADGDGSPAPSPAVENRARNTIGKGSPLRTSTKPISKHGSPAKVKTPVRRPETKKTSQGSAVAKTPGGGTFKVEKCGRLVALGCYGSLLTGFAVFKLDSPFLTPQPSRDVRLSDVSSSNYSQQSSPSANRSLRF